MSGVSVVWYLMTQHAPLTTLVPVARIKSGVLPQNTILPAISVNRIDSMERLTLSMREPYRYVTERVQVTALIKEQDSYPAGNDYPGLNAIITLVRQACPNQRGTINGVAVQCIIPDVEGPDLPGGETSILSRSRDFLVSYIQAV